MRQGVGTLESLTRTLVEHDVDILFLDCSPSGYFHANLDAICAFKFKKPHIDARELELVADCESKVAEFRYESRKRRGENEGRTQRRARKVAELNAVGRIRSSAYQQLGRTMLVRLMRLWAEVRVREHCLYADRRDTKGGEEYFLAEKVVEHGLDPWFLRLLSPEASGRKERVKLLRLLGFGRRRTRPDEEAADDRESLARTFEGVSAMDADANVFARFWNAIANTNADLSVEAERERRRAAGEPDDPDLAPLTVQAELSRHFASLRAWITEIIQRFAWRHAHLPLTMHGLVRLAGMRLWAAPYDPVEFHYDADLQILVPDAPDRFIEQVATPAKTGPVRNDRPLWALVSYQQEDRFIRLRFLPRTPCLLRVRIEIHYSIPPKSAPDGNGKVGSRCSSAIAFLSRRSSRIAVSKIFDASSTMSPPNTVARRYTFNPTSVRLRATSTS